MAHMKEFAAISGEIKAAGGTPIAVTAEVPEHLEKVRSRTGFTDSVIADPENTLARELKSRGLLDIAITRSQVFRLRGYKHGLAQPALLVMKDGEVLQRWAIVPGLVSSNYLPCFY
jgi:peroxiredoxin